MGLPQNTSFLLLMVYHSPIRVFVLLQKEADASFEEAVRRDPFSVRVWLAYISSKASSSASARNSINERAVRNIPGSYKLWKAYLEDRLRQTAKLAITDASVAETTKLCETALVTMHKMPRIWMMYLRHMARQFRVTATRQAFDRALRALPVTQHQHIWPIYQAFALQDGLPVSTGAAVLRRLVQFDPSAREVAVEYLLARNRPAEAARQLAVIVDDPTFRSKRGATRHSLWMQLCELLAANPQEIREAGDCHWPGTRQQQRPPLARQPLAAAVGAALRLWRQLRAWSACSGLA
jgi:pre-mRNA-splicing factor SYF1